MVEKQSLWDSEAAGEGGSEKMEKKGRPGRSCMVNPFGIGYQLFEHGHVSGAESLKRPFGGKLAILRLLH